MDPEEIAALLLLQGRAYRLILHLAGRARQEPAFMADAARHFESRRGCEAWLRDHCAELPEDTRPQESDVRAFAQLVWSLFQVSFRVDSMQWGERVIDTHVVQRSRTREPRLGGLRSIKHHALRSLFRRRAPDLTGEALESVVGNSELSEPLAIWTYVWELRQRAKGKAKGTVLHRLWRSMPVDVRKTLDPLRVEQAIAQLIGAGRVSPR